VTLEEQDRSLWDRADIERGVGLLAQALAIGRPGPYQLKAAMSAVHGLAPDAASTDWAAIVSLYDTLLGWEPTPIVQLNRAVAVAMASTPDAGLALLDGPALAAALRSYHLFHATRADLLRRAGRTAEAAAAYQDARRLTQNQAELAFLDERLALLDR
jgi:RNA polymerase sigma-70 factor (ECF subfamily)